MVIVQRSTADAVLTTYYILTKPFSQPKWKSFWQNGKAFGKMEKLLALKHHDQK